MTLYIFTIAWDVHPEAAVIVFMSSLFINKLLIVISSSTLNETSVSLVEFVLVQLALWVTLPKFLPVIILLPNINVSFS